MLQSQGLFFAFKQSRCVLLSRRAEAIENENEEFVSRYFKVAQEELKGQLVPALKTAERGLKILQSVSHKERGLTETVIRMEKGVLYAGL